MDAIDRKILAYVQKGGRDSYAEIGTAVGLSISAVNERLKKLHSSGAILHWSAAVDPCSVGRPVLAFAQVMTTADGKAAATVAGDAPAPKPEPVKKAAPAKKTPATGGQGSLF